MSSRQSVTGSVPPFLFSRGLRRSPVLPAQMVQAFTIASNSATGPVLALYSASLGASLALTSLIVATFTFTAMVTTVPFGLMADRVGRGPLLLASSVVSLAGAVVAFSAQDITMLILSRVLIGVAAGIYFPIIYAIVAGLAPPGGIGKTMANFGAATGIGMFVGPIFGGSIAQAYGYRATFLVSSVILVPNIFIIYRAVLRNIARPTARKTKAETGRKQKSPAIFSRNFVAGLASQFQLNSVGAIFNLLLPLYLVSTVHSVNVQELGILIGVSSLTGIFMRIFAASASDRFGRKVVILSGMLSVSLGIAILVFRSDFYSALTVATLFGAGQSMGQPAAGALVVDSTPKARVGMAMGVYQGAAFSGTTFGPVALGYLADSLGFLSSFGVASASNLAVAGALLILIKRGRPNLRVEESAAAVAGSSGETAKRAQSQPVNRCQQQE